MIEITRREMDRAYRDHSNAFNTLTSTSCSGLACLFYAVECGLKSLIMKYERQETTSGIDHFGHNLNKMLDHLRCEKKLRLPDNISLEPLKKPQNQQRNANQDELNQVWRYGVQPRDERQLTEKLEQVCNWIKEQR